MPDSPTEGNPATAARPIITCYAIDLPALARQAWDALHAANQPPTLFLSAGQPIRMEPDGASAMRTVELTPDRLTYHLARAAEWAGHDRQRQAVAISPPPKVVADMLAAPVAEQRLPVLTRIADCPAFSADGS